MHTSSSVSTVLKQYCIALFNISKIRIYDAKLNISKYKLNMEVVIRTNTNDVNTI